MNINTAGHRTFVELDDDEAHEVAIKLLERVQLNKHNRFASEFTVTGVVTDTCSIQILVFGVRK